MVARIFPRVYILWPVTPANATRSSHFFVLSFKLPILTSVSIAPMSSRKLVFPLFVSFIESIMRSRPVFAWGFVTCVIWCSRTARVVFFADLLSSSPLLLKVESSLSYRDLRLRFWHCIYLLLFIDFPFRSRCRFFNLMTNSFLVCVLPSYNKCSIFQLCSLRLIFRFSTIRICWRSDLFDRDGPSCRIFGTIVLYFSLVKIDPVYSFYCLFAREILLMFSL